MKLQTFFAFDPADSDERRVEKFAIFLVARACTLAGLVWTLGGDNAIRRLSFPVAYLALMVPLPFVERSTLPLAPVCSTG